jgi:hypothetical protein
LFFTSIQFQKLPFLFFGDFQNHTLPLTGKSGLFAVWVLEQLTPPPVPSAYSPFPPTSTGSTCNNAFLQKFKKNCKNAIDITIILCIIVNVNYETGTNEGQHQAAGSRTACARPARVELYTPQNR